MREIERIREDISDCDAKLMELLAKRMGYVEEVIEYKKINKLPIFVPEREAQQHRALEELLRESPYRQEQLNTFDFILKESKKVQARTLFKHNIALIGFMGVGKSTVSRCLSNMLSLEEVETDAMIVESEGMAITDIFAKYGEPYFRDCESQAIIALQNHCQAIISCGGGAVMREENVVNLKKSSRIVLLTATPETILERVKDSDERPILNGHMNVEYIAQLMEKRRPRYQEAADIIIATDKKSVLEVCQELVRRVVETEE